VSKHLLVQYDTRPQIEYALVDEATNVPLDLSDPATTIRCFLKKVNAAGLKETLLLAKLAGRVTSVDEDTGVQRISYAPPYDVPGAGGRCALQWSNTSLDEVGDFTGEIEVTFPDGGRQTVYEREQFQIRADDNGG
jgi:hypothetical protein